MPLGPELEYSGVIDYATDKQRSDAENTIKSLLQSAAEQGCDLDLIYNNSDSPLCKSVYSLDDKAFAAIQGIAASVGYVNHDPASKSPSALGR